MDKQKKEKCSKVLQSLIQCVKNCAPPKTVFIRNSKQRIKLEIDSRNKTLFETLKNDLRRWKSPSDPRNSRDLFSVYSLEITLLRNN